jgi:antitoxin PrlF
MDTLMIGTRGTVTLPAAMRERLGLKPGGLVLAEEKDGSIVLRPAAAVPVEIWSDEKITRLIEEDRLDPELAERLRRKFGVSA